MGGLIFANASARVDARVILCTATLEGFPVSLRWDDHQLELQPDEHAAKVYVFKKKDVQGEGIHRREIYFFSGAQASYHDTYGCLSDLKITLGKPPFRLQNLRCRREDSKECPP